MFPASKYLKWYLSIIAHAKSTTAHGYTEQHHIIPKSLGGNNASENIVRLTARAHFICHLLLVKMTSGKDRTKMVHAVWILKHTSKDTKVKNSRTFASLRTKHAEAVGNRLRGIPKSAAHCAKISAGKLGKSSVVSVQGLENRRKATIIANHARKGIKRSATVKQHLREIGMNAGANNPRAKTWEIETHSGEKITMTSMKPWCKAHGMVANTLAKTLYSGKFYRGFRVTAVLS